MGRVQVYYHIRKHLFSVKDKETGKVVLHTPSLFLDNVKFIVRPAGRDKVRETKVKNVHAFVEGDLASWDSGTILEASNEMSWDLENYWERRVPPILLPDRAYYDPYQVDQFHRVPAPRLSRTGKNGIRIAEPIETAERAHLIGKSVYIPRVD